MIKKKKITTLNCTRIKINLIAKCDFFFFFFLMSYLLVYQQQNLKEINSLNAHSLIVQLENLTVLHMNLNNIVLNSIFDNLKK